MRAIGRLFDVRDTLVRLVLLVLSGLSYLLFRPTGEPQPTPVQWGLAVAAFGLVLVLYRWPLASMLGQTALLAIAFAVLDDATINQVGSSWTLLELTIVAARPRVFYAAAGLLSAVYLVFEGGRTAAALGHLLLGLSVVVGVPVLLGLNIRGAHALNRQAQAQAEAERQRQESESRTARARERSAIARELHDVVAHHVASIVLRVAVARHVLPDLDPRVGEVFDDVHGTGTAALAELRQLVAMLRDPDAVRGDAAFTAIEPAALPAALQATVDRAAGTGLTVDADIAPSVGALDAVRGLAALRLTQEALTNVAKHAGPSARARLSVTVRDGDLHWEVTDDGGQPSEAPTDRPVGGGHGLAGMRERVEVLGGHLDAGPAGAGWRLRTVLPARHPGPDRAPADAGRAPGPAA